MEDNSDDISPGILAEFSNRTPLGRTIPDGTEVLTYDRPRNMWHGPVTLTAPRTVNTERPIHFTREPIDILDPPSLKFPTDRTVPIINVVNKNRRRFPFGYRVDATHWHLFSNWEKGFVTKHQNSIVSFEIGKIVAEDSVSWQGHVDEVKRSNCGIEVDGVYIQTVERWNATRKPLDLLDENNRAGRVLQSPDGTTREYTWSGAGWCSCTPRIGLERGHGLPTLAALCEKRGLTVVDWAETPDV